jgi:hypothetical protein
VKIVYYCKYCHTYLGEIDAKDVTEARLGFHSLTPEERADIITYDANDHNTYVKTICEFCHQALEYNPELTLVRNPLQ